MTLQFENHAAFWVLWILPLLFFVFLFFENMRAGLLRQFVDPAFLARRLPHYARLGSWWQFLFFLAALVLLILALLKPYDGFEMREITRQGVDIYFLVDLSPSMLAQDIKPGRLTRAKFEMKDFLGLLTGDRVGLIGFSGEPYIFVPLTSDYNAFALFLNELDTELIPSHGTDIAGAIAQAVSSLKKREIDAAKALILITDGEDSVGLDENVLEQIRAHEIKVFVIGIGTPEGAPVPQAEGGYITDNDGKIVISRLNEPALKSLALATGGGYVRSVSGDMDLREIYFKGIKGKVDAGEGKTLERKILHYRFQIFILLALLCLALEMLTTRRRHYWLYKFMFWKNG